MSILAYIVRHGATELSPQPEWQLQIPLNALGRAQATDAGEFLDTQKVKPVWGVSSDLKRAEETLALVSKVIPLEIVAPLGGLRAIDRDEPSVKFEARNKRTFDAILATVRKSKRVALIACHRSNTAYIAKTYSGVRQEIDYRQHSAVWEGGVVVLKQKGADMVAQPLYKTLTENPRSNISPQDGTSVSGFVTDEDNHPPRECGNCKWIHGGACHHPVVTADDELALYYAKVRNAQGYWMVGNFDCCNHFQHKVLVNNGGGA